MSSHKSKRVSYLVSTNTEPSNPKSTRDSKTSCLERKRHLHARPELDLSSLRVIPFSKSSKSALSPCQIMMIVIVALLFCLDTANAQNTDTNSIPPDTSTAVVPLPPDTTTAAAPPPPTTTPPPPVLTSCPANYYCPPGATQATPCPFMFISPANSTTLSGCVPPYSAKFTYTGSVTQWQVPAGVNGIFVKMWGAGGAGSSFANNNDWGEPGGSGGYSYGTIPVKAGNYLYMAVAGAGVGATGAPQQGGWPNGGTNSGGGNAGSGGGRSQISVFSSAQTIALSTLTVPNNIMMIAGGGGSACLSHYASGNSMAVGMAGGGFSGSQDPNGYNVAGNQTLVNTCTVASPCTKMVNGGFLKGADSLSTYCGAGGDGYYGGSSGMFNSQWTIAAGGAGGSGYINPVITDGNSVAGNNPTPQPMGSSAVIKALPSNSQDPVNNGLYGLGGTGSNAVFLGANTCAGTNGIIFIGYCGTNAMMQNGQCVCNRGYTSNGTHCLLTGCAPNTYNLTGVCTACPAQSTSLAGSLSINECTCNLGYYTEDITTGCTICPAGFYCNGNGSKFACQTTTYAAIGSSSCTTCPANSYCAGGIIASCPASSTSPIGSTTINNCACNSGYYTDDIASRGCTICPIGSYCLSNGTRVVCAAGYYTSSTGRTVCSPCTANSYCTNDIITACPTGSISTALSTLNSQCTCVPGYYTNDTIPGSRICQGCTNGSFCQAGVVVGPCPSGSTSVPLNGNGAYCSCSTSGYYFSNNTCKATAAGYAFNYDGILIQTPNNLNFRQGVFTTWATNNPTCYRGGSCVQVVDLQADNNGYAILSPPSSSFTIAFWFYYTTFAPNAVFMHITTSSGTWRMYTAGTPGLTWIASSYGAVLWDTASGLVVPNQWIHLVVSWTTTQADFYLNGANKRTATWPFSYGSTNTLINVFDVPGFYDDLILLPFALKGDSQAAGLYQNGITSVQLCSGPNQQLNGQGNCECTSGTFNNTGTCTVCYQGYYCVSGALLTCPAGTMSVAGSTSCTACSNPCTNTSIALATCGLKSCPAATPTQIGTTSWYGLGRVEVTTAGNGIVPVSTWSFGEIVLGMMLNATGDRPVSLVQTTLTVTTGKAYAIRFKAVCTGAQCAASLVVSITIGGTTTTALTVSQVARTWMELATPYFVPSASSVTIRFTAQMATASTDTIWIAHTTLADLGLWGYSSLSALQLLNGVTLPQRFSGSYVEYDTTVLMLISANGYLQFNASSLLPGQTYQLTLWSQGSTIGAQYWTGAAWAAMASTAGYDTWPSWTQKAWLANASSPDGKLYVRILANSGAVTIGSPSLSLQQPISTSPCVNCLPNYWCHGATINKCPQYTLSSAGASAQTDCFCQAGFYGSVGLGDYTGYSPCSVCPVNYFCTGGNSLQVCPDQTKSNAGASVCFPCAADEICSGGQVGTCPANSYAAGPVADVTQCLCVAGYYGTAPNCTLCQVGYYCPGGAVQIACTPHAVSPAGSTNSSQCFCDRGYYGVQNAACTLCPAGSWCWTGIMNGCPANMISPAGSSYQTDCQCNAGYTGPNGGPCSACSVGQYKDHIGTDQCVVCGAGTSSSTLAATSSSTCAGCSAGTFNPGSGQAACQPCAAGQYSTVQGALTCGSCGPGTFSVGSASTCTNCASGTFSTASQATAASRCTTCGTGYYAAAGSTACSACGGCPYFSWPELILAQFSGGLFTWDTITGASSTTGSTVLAQFPVGGSNYPGAIFASVGTQLFIIDPSSMAASLLSGYTPVETTDYQAILVSADSNSFFVAQGNAYRFDISSLSLINVYTVVGDPVTGLVQSLDGASLWTGSLAGLTQFDIATETVVQTIAQPSDGSQSVALSPCLSSAYPNTLFAVGAAPFGFRQYHAGQWMVLDTSLSALTRCQFTPDNHFVLLSSSSATSSGGVWLWSATLGTLQTISAQTASYGTLTSFSPNLLLISQSTGVIKAQGYTVLDATTCGSGLYSTSGGLASQSQCSLCPPGGLCPGGANLTYCQPGTQSYATGLRLQAQCGPCVSGYYCAGGAAIALCPLGAYSMGTAVGSAAACPLCPAGSYCPNTTTKITCPVNTNSQAGSSDLASCTCNAGYRCEVVQVVHAQITLPISIANFTALQAQYIAAVAAAAGVDPSQVIIVSITDSSGQPAVRRRRLLGEDANMFVFEPSEEDENGYLGHIEIHTSIYGSTHSAAPHRALRDLDAELVRQGLPAQSKTVQVFLHREVTHSAPLSRSLSIAALP